MSQMLCEFRDAQSHWEAMGVPGWKESKEEDVQMSRRFLSLLGPALPPTSCDHGIVLPHGNKEG